MLPIAVRNYVVSRTVVPVAWQGGTNFYIGNNPESDGATAVLPGTRASWWGGFNDVRRLAEEAAGRPLKGTEIDRYWFGRGLEFWRRQPGRAFALTARKLYLLVSGYEVSNNRDLYYFKRFTWLNLFVHNLPLFKFPFGVLLPLALAGVWLSRKAWRRLLPMYMFLCAYGLSFVLFFVTARFRMGMVPFIMILAAYAVTRLVRLRGRRLVAPLAIAAGSFLVVNMNIAGAGRKADPFHGSLAVATGLYETGRLEEARVELNRALVIDSAPELLKLKATVSMALGRADDAEAAARAALARLPNDPGACGTLGNVLAGQGRLDEARELFARVVELDPRSIEAWNNLGNIAFGRNELVRARGYYEQALAIDPTFVPALFHLGLVDYYGGNKELARVRWRTVLELDPGHANANRALSQLR
jgi:tetratricopeptide (TPR) repeat protein